MGSYCTLTDSLRNRLSHRGLLIQGAWRRPETGSGLRGSSATSFIGTIEPGIVSEVC